MRRMMSTPWRTTALLAATLIPGAAWAAWNAHPVATGLDQANGVTLADIDGDGDLDLAVTAAGGNTAAWYRNDGAGDFTLGGSLTASAWMHGIAAVDLQGTGLPDLVALSFADDEVLHYPNVAGSYPSVISIDNTLVEGTSLAVDDLDGDGDLDLAWSGQVSPGAGWFEDTGTSFVRGADVAGSTSGFQHVTTGDLDGDAIPDLIVAASRSGSARVAWYSNQLPTGWGAEQVLSSGVACHGVEAADLDEDGDLDVLSACWGDDTIGWYENDGVGNFAALVPITTAAINARDVLAADLDQDGHIDVISASLVDDTVRWFANDGTATFGAAQDISTFADGALRMTLGDLDGDGDLDVVVAEHDGDRFTWYENPAAPDTDGDGISDPFDCAPLNPNIHPGAVELCDGLDNDCDSVADDGTPCDTDGDGVPDSADCQPLNAAVFPGAVEACNGLDDDCDGLVDPDELDVDGDGYAVCDGDCDPLDPRAYPTATEVCDGIDNDCVTGIDEGLDTDNDGVCDSLDPCPADATDDTDGDGVCDGVDLCAGNDAFGDADADGRCEDGTDLCVGLDTTGDGDSDGYCAFDLDGTTAIDCDDTAATRFPGAPELCNRIDDDCDGSLPPWDADADADGIAICEGDCADGDADRHPGATELCNSLDDDCDGSVPVDEIDADGDGVSACEGDCNPLDASAHPNGNEVCDGVDNNCDDSIDEGFDADGDGVCDDDDPCPLDNPDDADGDGICDIDDLCYGDDRYGDADEDGICDPPPPACAGAPSSGDTDGDGICNNLDGDDDGDFCSDGFDADPLVASGDEDEDGVADDCDICAHGDDTADRDQDGTPNACDPCPFDPFTTADSDGDGVCDPSDICLGFDPSGDKDEDGYCVLDSDRVKIMDCDDEDPYVFPGAVEWCDGKDNACTGNLPDEEADLDQDGLTICEGDCDDNDFSRYPGAPEVCDGVDNNCDSVVPHDELDADGDGYSACEGDCAPVDVTTFPGAVELCDGIDNDCDNRVPENEADDDNDDFRICEGDCADNDPRSYPNAPEICGDNIDQDCDGESVNDENCLRPEEECSCTTGPQIPALFLPLLPLLAVVLRRRSPTPHHRE